MKSESDKQLGDWKNKPSPPISSIAKLIFDFIALN